MCCGFRAGESASPAAGAAAGQKRLRYNVGFASLWKVVQLNAPVNTFDERMFGQVKEEQGVYKTTAAKADAIAHATKRVITEKMDEDPAFYEKFSKLIQQAIDDFRARRLSDLAYLERVIEIRDKVVRRQHDDIPDILKGNEDAAAYYGVIKPFFEQHVSIPEALERVGAETAMAFEDVLQQHWKVLFWEDADAQNKVIDRFEDYLYDEVINPASVRNHSPAISQRTA